MWAKLVGSKVFKNVPKMSPAAAAVYAAASPLRHATFRWIKTEQSSIDWSMTISYTELQRRYNHASNENSDLN